MLYEVITGVTNINNMYSSAGFTPTCAPDPNNNGLMYNEAPVPYGGTNRKFFFITAKSIS